ncbi:MAG: hypothetical protein ACRCZD_11030 [Phycicoccus sp.]
MTAARGANDEPCAAGMPPSPEERWARSSPAERAAPLLRVSTPADARAALDAARDLSVVHPGGVRWLALQQAALPGAVVITVAGIGWWFRPGPSSALLVISGPLVVLAGTTWLPLARASGVEHEPRPPHRRWWARFAAPALTAAALLAVGVASWRVDSSLERWWSVALTVLVASLAAVEWRRATGRLASATGPAVRWPPGAEAFALLSCLAKAGVVLESWLVECAGMREDVGRRWVARLVEDDLVERVWFGRGVEVGDEGEDMLEVWRAELEALAAGGSAPPETS